MSGDSLRLKVAFVAVFLAVGIPYWMVPYNKALPAPVIAIGFAALVAAGAFLAFHGTRWSSSFVVPGLAVPAAAMARIVVEVFHDKTSHNLWPFEIVMATGIGIPVALVGAALGRLLAKALRGDEPPP
jgi:ABC-type thiamin/hydroxymethylpyrimidine transport system permease subunit